MSSHDHWITYPTHGSVCNHFERMMEGRTIDDLIYKRDKPSLTENDVEAYVRQSHRNYQAWDEWPLRMTFRINSYLRTAPSVPEPDLDFLNSF